MAGRCARKDARKAASMMLRLGAEEEAGMLDLWGETVEATERCVCWPLPAEEGRVGEVRFQWDVVK